MLANSYKGRVRIYCQDRFFADLIFRGVRGSGHGLVVRPKGYVGESCFLKGRKADRGFRQGVQDYSVVTEDLVQAQTRVKRRIGQR